MCGYNLFDESAVIHPDQACFTTYKNCVRSAPVDQHAAAEAPRNRFESAPKHFQKLYPHGKFERSDAHTEWEDVDAADGEDPGDLPLESANYQTDWTRDTSRQTAPAYRKACTSIYVSTEDPSEKNALYLSNLSEHIEAACAKGETMGEIECVFCAKRGRSTKLGKFAVCGAQCSCGKYITPSAQFISSKVDILQLA